MMSIVIGPKRPFLLRYRYHVIGTGYITGDVSG